MRWRKYCRSREVKETNTKKKIAKKGGGGVKLKDSTIILNTSSANSNSLRIREDIAIFGKAQKSSNKPNFKITPFLVESTNNGK